MSNRFKKDNAELLVRHLVESGIDPTAKLAKADTSLHGGCVDPDCCPQGSFPGMMSVISRLTDSQLHKEAVLAHIVPPRTTVTGGGCGSRRPKIGLTTTKKSSGRWRRTATSTSSLFSSSRLIVIL